MLINVWTMTYTYESSDARRRFNVGVARPDESKSEFVSTKPSVIGEFAGVVGTIGGNLLSYSSPIIRLPLFLFKLLNSLIMFGGNSDLTGIELGGFMFGKGKEKGMCNNVQRK